MPPVRRGARLAKPPHQGVDILEFPQRRPVAVSPPPGRSRRKPDRERLGKVLVGVFLGIGPPVLARVDVANELPAGGLRVEGLAVGLREGAKNLRPARLLPQAVGIADRVARLVTHQHHHHLLVFDLPGLLLLDPGQAFVGQIEGDADHGHPVGTAPGVGQIERGPKRHPLGVELAVQPLGERLDRRTLDPQPQIANPRMEQLAADRFPAIERRWNLGG